MRWQRFAHDVVDIGAVSSMLRSERTAVEIYEYAVAHVASDGIRQELDEIREDHEAAAAELRQWMAKLDPNSTHSGAAWGYFAAAVLGMSTLAGEAGLLAALKRGERHAETLYSLGLGNPDLPDAFRHYLGARLLPQCQAHLKKLEELQPVAGVAE